MPLSQKVNLLVEWAGELTPEKLFDNGTKCDIRGNSLTSWKKLFYLEVGQAHFFCCISRRKKSSRHQTCKFRTDPGPVSEFRSFKLNIQHDSSPNSTNH